MRPLLSVALTLCCLAAACSDSGSAKDVTIDLRIVIWPEGRGAGKPVSRYRLRCNPLAGNLPHGDRACYSLAVTPRPFASVPRDAVCTQVYGGPQVARVQGRFRGQAVRANFRRTNGCETARWDQVSSLLPVRL